MNPLSASKLLDQILPDLAWQITVWLAAGLLVHAVRSRFQSRRQNRIYLRLLVLGVLALSAASLTPAPLWRYSLATAPSGRELAANVDPGPVAANSEAHRLSGPTFPTWLQRWSAGTTLSEGVGPCRTTELMVSWAGILAAACAVYFLARLAAGWWSLGGLLRRSMAIDDPELWGVVQKLTRDMGIKMALTLRATSDLDSPATLGWRRPVILLPLTWRTWDSAQLLCVMAHELAHVRASDYLAWCFAQMTLILHGYQPLLHLALSRLQAAQELAADELAATHAGGTDVYVRSLSQLALRHGSRRPVLPAQALLPVNLSLARRMVMLRACQKMGNRGRSGTVAITAMVLLGALLSGWRGPASAEPPASAKSGVTKGTGGDSRCQVPGDGVVVFRLASLLNEPGVRAKVEPALRGQIHALATATLGKCPESLRVDDVDHVVATFDFRPKTAERMGTVSTSLAAVVLKPHKSWEPILAELIPGFNLAKHLKDPAGVDIPTANPLEGQPKQLRLVFRDERTVLVGGAKDIAQVLESEPIEWTNLGGIKELANTGGWFTVVINMTNIREKIPTAEDGVQAAMLKPWEPIYRHAERLAASALPGERVAIRVVAVGGDTPMTFEQGALAAMNQEVANHLAKASSIPVNEFAVKNAQTPTHSSGTGTAQTTKRIEFELRLPLTWAELISSPGD